MALDLAHGPAGRAAHAGARAGGGAGAGAGARARAGARAHAGALHVLLHLVLLQPMAPK